VKAQESFHQDLATWVEALALSKVKGSKSKPGAAADSQPSTLNSQPLFVPAWDILPHEAKLPHVDVISERLETLVALAEASSVQSSKPKAGKAPGSPLSPPASPLVVANVVALMQRTFPPGAIAQRTRTLRSGQQINPLDLVEWLEEEGYEPEAQVNSKGEIALRGGILDLFPPTSPWPFRVEFFGDEIESIREFDPSTQLSREPVDSATIAPAGELGILKRLLASGTQASPQFSTLLDYLPAGALVVVCEPEAVA
jgi:transcription-repair coupling factor (superfamily II helicase)